MKKLIFFLSLLSFSSYAQIEQVEVKTPPPAANKTIGYDSTEYSDPGNYKERNMSRDVHDSLVPKMVRRFIGQEVIVLPKSHKYTKNNEYTFLGYGSVTDKHRGSVTIGKTYNEDFYVTTNPQRKNGKYDRYMPVKGQLLHEWPLPDNLVPAAYERSGYAKQGKSVREFLDDRNEYDWFSDYDALANKKFRIVDLVNNYYLLVNERNGDTMCYYHYGSASGQRSDDEAFNILPPLLVVGYYEKLKQQSVNNDFVYTGDSTRQLMDNATGKPAGNVNHSEWKCTKIALADYADEPYQKLTYLLENAAGNQLAIEKDTFKRNFTSKAVYLKKLEDEYKRNEEIKAWQEKQAKEKADAEKREKIASKKEAEEAKARKAKRRADLIAKYGNEMGTMIADGKVKIGMTKEMCIAAWGKPFDIHTSEGVSSYSEQWVYGLSSYLYFNRQGVLDFIQN